MKTVLISPFSRKLSTGENPKNYPHWKEVVSLLKSNNIKVIQVGLTSEGDIGANERKSVPFQELYKLVDQCDTWASVDNFFHHMCAWRNKKGVVVFGKSDPRIFGHQGNINLLKGEKYLRSNQWGIWEEESFSPSVFVDPDIVTLAICSFLEH